MILPDHVTFLMPPGREVVTGNAAPVKNVFPWRPNGTVVTHVPVKVVDRHGDTDFVAGIPGSQAASGDLEAEDEDVCRGQIEVTELDDVACQQDAGVFDLAGVIVDVPRHRERATEHGA